MTEKAKNLHSLVQTAAIFGVHRNTVSKWLDQGCPVARRANRDRGIEWGLYLPDVIAWREAEAVRKALAPYVDGSGQGKRDEADARRAEVEAQLAELRLSKELREVVLVADVVTVVSTEYAAVRAKLAGVGAKIAGRLSTLTSPTKIREAVDGAICEALEALKHDRRLAQQQEE